MTKKRVARSGSRIGSGPGSAAPPLAARIIPAAIACIGRFGAGKTTIEDVATEAGIGRQTIYRAYPTRAKLFEAVALQRLAQMQSRMQSALSTSPSLERAIVRGTVQLQSVARKDRIFMSVVEAADDRGLERYLLDPTPAIRRIMVDLWAETFARARDRGELRADLKDADIADWLRFVNYMLFVREDLSARAQRRLLEQFVLPALSMPGSV